MTSKKKVRVAIIGVGNCASSLVQGTHYYREAQPDDFVPGLMHVDLAGYHISDIEFSAAFDIDQNKVGKDIGEAIYAAPNNTYRFADVPKLCEQVFLWLIHDGFGIFYLQVIYIFLSQRVDFFNILHDTGIEA